LDSKLEEKFHSRLGVVETTILRAAGLGESAVDSRLSDLLRDSVNPSLGILAGLFETRILVSASARSKAEAERLAEPILEEIERRLGDDLIGRRGLTLTEALADQLAERGLRLALIDSATDGRAGAEILERLRPANLACALSTPPGREAAAAGLAAEEFGADLAGLISLAPEDEPATVSSFEVDRTSNDAEGGQKSAALVRILVAPRLAPFFRDRPRGESPSYDGSPEIPGLVEIFKERRSLAGAGRSGPDWRAAFLIFRLWRVLRGIPPRKS
jgi:hypothetical protein